ncbi:MAG: hypothetical protein AB2L14_06625 [Candidatus Xenobiia bacterium LiM19]
MNHTAPIQNSAVQYSPYTADSSPMEKTGTENLESQTESLSQEVYCGSTEQTDVVDGNAITSANPDNTEKTKGLGGSIKTALSAATGFTAGYIIAEIQKNTEAAKNEEDKVLKNGADKRKPESGSIQLTGNLAITPKMNRFVREGALNAVSIYAANHAVQPSLLNNVNNPAGASDHFTGAGVLTAMLGLGQMMKGIIGLEQTLTNSRCTPGAKPPLRNPGFYVNIGDIVTGSGVFATMFSPIGLPVALAGAGISTIAGISEMMNK